MTRKTKLKQTFYHFNKFSVNKFIKKSFHLLARHCNHCNRPAHFRRACPWPRPFLESIRWPPPENLILPPKNASKKRWLTGKRRPVKSSRDLFPGRPSNVSNERWQPRASSSCEYTFCVSLVLYQPFLYSLHFFLGGHSAGHRPQHREQAGNI